MEMSAVRPRAPIRVVRVSYWLKFEITVESLRRPYSANTSVSQSDIVIYAQHHIVLSITFY